MIEDMIVIIIYVALGYVLVRLMGKIEFYFKYNHRDDDE